MPLRMIAGVLFAGRSHPMFSKRRAKRAHHRVVDRVRPLPPLVAGGIGWCGRWRDTTPLPAIPLEVGNDLHADR